MIKNSATLNMSVQENIEALQEEIKKLKSIIAKGGKYIEEDDNNNANINNKDYICPICNNEPIEVNQEKIMMKFKNEINQLMELIIKNFKSEENVRNQFMNLDEKIISSGFKFYSLVDKYKSDYDQKLKELNNEIKLYQDFIKKMKENMDKVNQKVIDFKSGDSMDKIIFGEISQLNTLAEEIMKRLEDIDITYYKKIETENYSLLKEKEISENIKTILELKIRNEIEQKEINSNAKNIQDSVNQFINSNDAIIKFFSENFLNKPYFKEELVLLEKSKYDLLLFQIGEGKITERSLKKQIEQMEMDNYLNNIDLLRMKSQLEAYKSQRRKIPENINNTNNSIPILNLSNKEVDIIKEEKNEEENENKNDDKINSSDNDDKDNKNIDENSYDSNPDESDNENKEDSNKNIKTFNRKRTRKGIIRIGSLDATATFEKAKKFAVNINNLEIIKMKESLDEINDDLSDKIAENEELKQEIFDLNNKIEKMNLKIQEGEDNIKELNQQIEALDTTNEVFEKNIEELSNYKKFVDNELENMFKLKNEADDKINQLLKIFNETNDRYKNKCEVLFNKIKDLIIQNEETKKLLELNNNEIKEIIIGINENENKFISLFDNMEYTMNNIQEKITTKQYELNNIKKEKNIIIENKRESDERNKKEINLLNNDINKYKNTIMKKDKIIQLYIENEEYLQLQYEEINKLLSTNNTKIKNLNDIYIQDMSLINKYYTKTIIPYRKTIINFLSKNDIELEGIKHKIKNNNDSLDALNIIYNSCNNNYFDKCCHLLNEINNKEIKIKYLKEKNNNQQISENNLNIKISYLEQEISILKEENKNNKQSYEIKIKENMLLKKQEEDLENQIKQLNKEIISYLDQIKQKEIIFDELNNNQKKININLNELENKNKMLNLSMNEKNELINQLQTEANKQNKLIEELNTKNLNLIKELETEKNKDALFNRENNKNTSQMNELNNKISTLFSEIANKDKIITNLNNEHAELSKQIGDFILEKNETVEKIRQKEEEINNNQKKMNEINQKLLEKNKEFNEILNEKKEKIEEIKELKYCLNEMKQNIEEKNNEIKKLNNKITLLEQLSKKGKNNYLNYNKVNVLNNNNLENEKNLNGMIHINSFNKEEEIETLNINKFMIEKLKNKNEELIIEKIKLINNVSILNTKNLISECLSNLFFKLLNEFNIYLTDFKHNKDINNDKNILLLNELFINEKISKCDEDIKTLEKEININLVNKTDISNNILENISLYIKEYNTSNDKFINICNKYILKIEQEEKGDNIQEILEDIIDSINVLSLNNIPIFNLSQELFDLLNNMNKAYNNKFNSLENLIKVINESYNEVVIEEINCNDNIIYYQNKNSNNTNNKNKNINQGQSDDEKLLQSYNEYKDNILNVKDKYKEIINKFLIYKNYVKSQKNIIENNIAFFKNLNVSDIKENNYDENNEFNYDMKLILNKIENDKNLLRQLINKTNDNINNNIYNNKECLESKPDNIKLKEVIEKGIAKKYEIEEKIKELKSNLSLLKNLPSNYESYKKYLSISILESKNKILEEKLKIIFGTKFNVNNIYNIDLKPDIVWNKNEIPKLISEIMILRENKNLLEKDYNALQLAFNLALKGKEGINDNQLIILFKIKEENKQLKIELKKIKEKNNFLQGKIKKLIKDNSNNKTALMNEIYENINTNNYYMNNLVDSSLSEIKDNFNNTNIPSMKKKVKIKRNDSKDNNSILNDISNGFTPQRKKKKFISCEKYNK